MMSNKYSIFVVCSLKKQQQYIQKMHTALLMKLQYIGHNNNVSIKHLNITKK